MSIKELPGAKLVPDRHSGKQLWWRVASPEELSRLQCHHLKIEMSVIFLLEQL